VNNCVARVPIPDLSSSALGSSWSPSDALPSFRRQAIVRSRRRHSPLSPQVPTMKEAGFPSYSAISWVGLLGPAGIPAPIVQRINDEAVKALKSPEGQRLLKSQDAEIGAGSPEQLRDFMAADFCLRAELESTHNRHDRKVVGCGWATARPRMYRADKGRNSHRDPSHRSLPSARCGFSARPRWAGEGHSRCRW
jgi:Tripartite tricarboxylate transporter family receptor